jgi:hypothetical protein
MAFFGIALPDTPSGNHTMQSMFQGWLTVMVPLGLAAWLQSRSVSTSIGAFIATPCLAILQGAIGILSYRHHFGDAPQPHTPAHGVVVVSPEDLSKDVHVHHGQVGCCCMGGKRWRRGGALSESNEQVVTKASQEPPLRLLVIGDSLAIGVGTNRSCTPMLPEVIARTLSKAMGGRAVYWTSHGAAGASAGWIVRELERGIQLTKEDPNQPGLETSDSSSEDSSESEDGTIESFSETSLDDATIPLDEQVNDQVRWDEWRSRLHRHRKRFDPQVMGPYDISIVLTGSNDLKASFFPFLLHRDEREFHRQAQARGGAYSGELRRVLEVLSKRMQMTVQESIERVKGQMQLPSSSAPLVPEVPVSIKTDIDYDENDIVQEPPTPSNFTRPLIVLPGNPARALPSFQVYPLKWLSVPMVAITDNNKRALAQAHPENVLFVEAATPEQIIEYEGQRGALWDQRAKEDTLVALRDVSKLACQRVERTMMDYYNSKSQKFGYGPLVVEEPHVVTQTNAPNPPLSERPGRPGSKIFSCDGVHPNDEGYDFWGRHIANAIVQELKR